MYYLLKITGNGSERLQKRLKDDWGMSFPTRAEVGRGYFLTRQQADACLHSYFVEKGRVAVVYAATVRYICPELEGQLSKGGEKIELSEQLHS